jgi:hypothetical protein
MHLVIHLFRFFIWLLRGLAKLWDRKPIATIPFDCPKCNQVRLASVIQTVEYDQSIRPTGGVRSFRCHTCKSAHNADSFRPDNSGVYQIIKWDCPQCATLNPNTTFICQSCGHRFA